MFDSLDKHGRNKIFRITFFVLAAVYIILTIFLYLSYNSYNYKGHKLRVVTIDNNGMIMMDNDGNELVLTVLNGDIAEFDKNYNISYLDEAIICVKGFEEGGRAYTFSDGSQVKETGFSRIYMNGKESLNIRLSELQAAERELIFKLEEYYTNYKDVGVFVLVDFFGLLFVLAGVGSIIYPETFWRFQHFLDVRGGEPTDFAIITNRIGGVILTVAAYGSLFVLLA